MELSQEQIKLLKSNKIIPHDCPPEQVQFFIEVCRRKKLDPFQRQIHLISRNERTESGGWTKVYTIQSGIDGMRAIAQRIGKVRSTERGIKEIDGKIYGWCRVKTSDGEYYDELPLEEYIQRKKDGTPNAMWARMPYTMLKKCAEESVLRMCAPEDLSGVYGDDEMEQSDGAEKNLLVDNTVEYQPKALPPVEVNVKEALKAVGAVQVEDKPELFVVQDEKKKKKPVPVRKPTQAEMKKMLDKAKACHITDGMLKALVEIRYGISTLHELTMDMWQDLMPSEFMEGLLYEAGNKLIDIETLPKYPATYDKVK